MKKLVNYLLQGILYLAPIGIIAYIVYGVFIYIDSALQKVLIRFFDIEIPGLGVVSLLLFLILIGYLGRTIIAKPLQKIFKKTIDNIPLLGFIYTALNDLLSAFVGKEKKFSKPVLVKVNLNSDLEKLGFITEENLKILDEKQKVAVYFPHSYNFSGELFIVPRAQIKLLEIPSSEVMKFIVSAGLSKWGEKSN